MATVNPVVLFGNAATSCAGPSCSRSDVAPRTVNERQYLRATIGTVVAGHVAVFSFLFGPRVIAYALTAYLSAVVVFGVLFLQKKPRRRAAWIAGMACAVFIQQAAYHTLLPGQPSASWSLAQFFALQFLVAISLNRMIRSWTRAHSSGLSWPGELQSGS